MIGGKYKYYYIIFQFIFSLMIHFFINYLMYLEPSGFSTFNKLNNNVIIELIDEKELIDKSLLLNNSKLIIGFYIKMYKKNIGKYI